MLPHHYNRHLYHISLFWLQNDGNEGCQQFIAVEEILDAYSWAGESRWTFFRIRNEGIRYAYIVAIPVNMYRQRMLLRMLVMLHGILYQKLKTQWQYLLVIAVTDTSIYGKHKVARVSHLDVMAVITDES